MKACTITAHYRWWVFPYLKALKAFGEMTGTTLDAEKAAWLISKHGVRIQLRALE